MLGFDKFFIHYLIIFILMIFVVTLMFFLKTFVEIILMICVIFLLYIFQIISQFMSQLFSNFEIFPLLKSKYKQLGKLAPEGSPGWAPARPQ